MIRSAKEEKVYQEMCIEMFRRVGLEKTFPEILEYGKDPEWFKTMTWTSQEQESFKKWGCSLMAKKRMFTRGYRDSVMLWFLFDIGWRVEDVC